MNIAIAGAGIAGGYLAALLAQEGLSPEVYDPMAHDTRCGCRSCRWGAPAWIGPHLDAIGLDPEEYILEPMPSMNFDGLVARTPLLTVDKPRLLRDLTRDVTVRRQALGPEEAEPYDVIVDATGLARAHLPPCTSDLTLPTLQHRVAVEPRGEDRLAAGVYGNDVPGLGYLWVFPLGEDEYHVGIGEIGLASPESLMERFYREMSGRYAFTRLCGCRGAVRVASPYYSVPLYTENRRGDGTAQLIVGVGESIGTVAPFTGEGISFSLDCARMLAERIADPAGYARAVLARFAWMRRDRETLDYLLAHRETKGPRLRDRWRFYRSARRSGIELPMIEAFPQLGSLLPWVDSPEEGRPIAGPAERRLRAAPHCEAVRMDPPTGRSGSLRDRPSQAATTPRGGAEAMEAIAVVDGTLRRGSRGPSAQESLTRPARHTRRTGPILPKAVAQGPPSPGREAWSDRFSVGEGA